MEELSQLKTPPSKSRSTPFKTGEKTEKNSIKLTRSRSKFQIFTWNNVLT